MHLGAVGLLLPLCFCVQLEWIAGVAATGWIGTNYGSRMESEPAEELVQLIRSRGIGKIRLHDADSTMLRATSSSSSEAPIEVIVGLRNDEIVDVGVFPASAQSWVARNVVPHFPATHIIAIAVGNEVLTSEQADHAAIVPFLVPAMRNLHAALSEVGLERQIEVCAPQSARVLSSYFPPSSATFNGEIMDRVMAPLLEFLAMAGSSFMLNVYPLDVMGLNVGQPEAGGFSAGGGINDPQTGRHYSNMFEVLSEAVSVAMGPHHQPRVMGIEMDWSRNSASYSSNAFLVDHSPKGSVVDIGPKFGEDLVINPPQVEKKVRVGAFSSRRFLSDVLQYKEHVESGKRRRLAPNKSWCVAKSTASTNSLQLALDWACGAGGANCQPIQKGQSCFLPNDIVAHASYAFNNYYQKQSWASGSCDFGGLAQTTTSDPSSASCLYTSSTSANGTPSTPTGTVVPSVAASRFTWYWCRFIVTSFVLIILVNVTLLELMI